MCLRNQVLDDMQKDLRKARMWRYGATLGTLCAGAGLTGASVFLSAPQELTIGVATGSMLSAAGLQVTRVWLSRNPEKLILATN